MLILLINNQINVASLSVRLRNNQNNISFMKKNICEIKIMLQHIYRCYSII